MKYFAKCKNKSYKIIENVDGKVKYAQMIMATDD